MKILNTASEDFHSHSITFSDGLNSIDEMVIHAGIIGLKRLAITDHCQAYLDAYGYARKTNGNILYKDQRWVNVHNKVEVEFGVEADLLNEHGSICSHIQGFQPKWIILSAHKGVYTGDTTKIKFGYLRAIEEHKQIISCIGHLCSVYFEDHLSNKDIREIIQCANKAGIPLEMNCANFVNKKTNLTFLKILLNQADSIYLNSDAHSLYELQTVRTKGLAHLKKQGYKRS